MSPLLHVLVAETLACKIRNNPTIGIPIPDIILKAKVSQHAADTSVFVMNDQAILELFQIFSCYEKASCAKLNMNKREGLLMGPWKARSDLPVSLKWTNVNIKCPGSKIANDNSENWDSKVDKLEKTLTSWSNRKLSLKGRATITNILGFSLLPDIC